MRSGIRTTRRNHNDRYQGDRHGSDGHIAVSARTKWYDGLTPANWRVLRASFSGGSSTATKRSHSSSCSCRCCTRCRARRRPLRPPSMRDSWSVSRCSDGGIGGLVGGILADYCVGRKRMMLWSVFFMRCSRASRRSPRPSGRLRCASSRAWRWHEWSTGVALLSETWPERARAKRRRLGNRASAGARWSRLSYGMHSPPRIRSVPRRGDWSFALGAIPAFFVLYIRAVWTSRKNGIGRFARSAGTPRLHRPQPRRPPVRLRANGPSRWSSCSANVKRSSARWCCWCCRSSRRSAGERFRAGLPTFTVALAKAEGLPDAVSWGSKISVLSTQWARSRHTAWWRVSRGRNRPARVPVADVCRRAPHDVHHHKLTTACRSDDGSRADQRILHAGCAYVWMAIYPCELFTSAVRSTAISFVFNAARLIAWVFRSSRNHDQVVRRCAAGGNGARVGVPDRYRIAVVSLLETRGKGMPD